MCSTKEQSDAVLTTQNHNVNQCVAYEEQDKTSKQECTAHDISMYDDKICQSTLCYDKNCQDTQCVHMWPVKLAMKSSHMWSVKQAVTQSLCDEKNCQSTKCIHV